jgi:putative RNA 2'-phosphotransferase
MMNERRMIRISKYLSKHLRHEPERIGITLDEHGWVPVDVLLRAAADHGFTITAAELWQVVEGNDKQRYAIEDGRIRASQGHSVPVDLDLPVLEPPEVLYHGTVGRFVAAIKEEGLRPMNRHHVHLSPDRWGRAGAYRWCWWWRRARCTPTGTRSGAARTGCGWWTRCRRATCASPPERAECPSVLNAPSALNRPERADRARRRGRPSARSRAGSAPAT